MKFVELHYNVRVVPGGHRFCKDVVREWPEGASLGDVMKELCTELESLGCEDITVTKTDRPFAAERETLERPMMGNGNGFGGRSFDGPTD